MNSFTKNVLQKLRLYISLKILLNNPETRTIYYEISKARTAEMLLDAIKKLPPEELEEIKKKLDNNLQSALKPGVYIKFKKYIPNKMFFKFDNNKKHPRLVMIEEIKRRKSSSL